MIPTPGVGVSCLLPTCLLQRAAYKAGTDSRSTLRFVAAAAVDAGRGRGWELRFMSSISPPGWEGVSRTEAPLRIVFYRTAAKRVRTKVSYTYSSTLPPLYKLQVGGVLP